MIKVRTGGLENFEWRNMNRTRIVLSLWRGNYFLLLSHNQGANYNFDNLPLIVPTAYCISVHAAPELAVLSFCPTLFASVISCEFSNTQCLLTVGAVYDNILTICMGNLSGLLH